ncbi:hypothetical protein ACFOD4_15540 [Pseudoroseomonas globiformis]|uniref:ApeI dehydratase-like domain-containing protein n=1 Tax=Teichococcus globiformis TaxID=2307229 RepID=A0ABV7G758_9PROT
MQHQSEFAFPPDHPVFAGHFPGRPLVPGVALLDAAFVRMAADGRVARLVRAKFTAPVGPDDPVSLSWQETGPERLAFQARCRGVPAFSGEAVLVARDSRRPA